ncbi:thiopeptide-type bacteriocin biosynthesis protein [Saccharopolyspora cebuensis]
MSPHTGLLRIAALSVEDAARLIAEDRIDAPEVADAIALAAGPQLLGDAAHRPRARTSALRYIARMGGRATPFGLFAGTAPVRIGQRRHLVLGDRHRVRVRIDVAALEALVGRALAEADPARTPLRVNPSARIAGPSLRFARPGDATAEVVEMRATPLLLEVVELLDCGAAPGEELVARLRGRHPGLPTAKLSGFLDAVVAGGLLVPAADLIEPGVEPARRALDLLERIGDAPRAALLRSLLAETGERPAAPGLVARLGAAWRTATATEPALAGIAANARFDVQLRTCAPAAELDDATAEDLRGAALRLEAVCAEPGARPPVPGALDPAAFRAAFRARYEDAEVPLLEAVDLESGVLRTWQRGTSELAGEAGVVAEAAPEAPDLPATPLRVLERWMREGGDVDIADLPPVERPRSRAVLALLLDDARGPFHSVLVGAVGRSPHALSARFAMDRPELADALRREIQGSGIPGSEVPGAASEPIRAELVHHGGGRIGNVLIRPRLLTDAIALGGAAGGTLRPDRLLLRLRGDEFLLRDSVTGRPVVVELNSAHNVDLHGLDPLYAVLGHLASDGGAGWSWGPLARLPHLPRVVCGRVIVAPEQWRLRGEEVREVLTAGDPAGRLRKLLRGAEDRRWVGTGSQDHVLPIDLDSSRSVLAALSRDGAADHLRLVELPQVEAPAVTGPTGGHVAEAVVPLGPVHRTARSEVDIAAPAAARAANWVYFQYFAGQAASDEVVDRAAALAEELRGQGLVGDWFFLRYQDDGYHVRVRMRATSPAARPSVLTAMDAFGRRLRATGLATRAVLRDYVPEIARYGGEAGLPLAESLFTASSERAVALLARGRDEEGRLFRTVADVLHWTGALFPDPDRRLEFLRRCQGGLGVAFTPTGNRHGKFARAHGARLEELLAGTCPDERVDAALSRLADSVRERLPERRAWSVFGSALHLHCNRMFAFDAVRLEYLAHELAIRAVRRRKALDGNGTSGERGAAV